MSDAAAAAHEVLLADGDSALVRPVRADDGPRVEAFHRALSLETVHFRYFSGLAVLPKSGHGINLEEPALFNRLLEDFFHQVDAGRWGARDPRARVPSIYGPAGRP